MFIKRTVVVLWVCAAQGMVSSPLKYAGSQPTIIRYELVSGVNMVVVTDSAVAEGC